jgi:uncharacterized membrane protein HdeD (DUF308 family)
MDFQHSVHDAVSSKSIAWDAVLMVSGVVAMMAPQVTSVNVTIVLAWVLMGVGITHLVSSWHAATVVDVAQSSLVGSLYLFVGLAIQRHPMLALTSLTMIIGFALVAEGVVGLFVYFGRPDRLEPSAVRSVVTLILGEMLLNQWPFSSISTIGFLVGLNFLFAGASHALAAGSQWIDRPRHA